MSGRCETCYMEPCRCAQLDALHGGRAPRRAPTSGPRLVVLESPYAGDVEANVDYARRCVRDCLRRGEAPIASHLLYTQPGVLRDAEPEERRLGIAAGHAWIPAAQALAVYADRGVSRGMEAGITTARAAGVPVEFRSLADDRMTYEPGHYVERRDPRSNQLLNIGVVVRVEPAFYGVRTLDGIIEVWPRAETHCREN